MAKTGPILILEDDEDDREIYSEVMASLGVKNEIMFFEGGDDLLRYLQATNVQPFIIISDINLPRMSGLELRRLIDADELLRRKSIPFVFLTTNESKDVVDEVYELSVQGYFVKKYLVSDIERQFRQILDYWQDCKHPNA
ncbi:response regulator [Chitinophaga sp. CF418]|uniref:response regulator n=1 Tax=Chitinophaga sp. CF418 TaxID=1855287 RepID=UPI00091176CC|nr:response regulator [Chitinophaga sp. CF418]SHN28761.1 CheY chemotaxis protein or a CheY-like REC (receiver) domain [Chitinophaga sp. CF418]